MAGLIDRIRFALQIKTSPRNPVLLQALNQVALKDEPSTRAALYRALLEATFIVPGEVTGGHGGIADENTRLSMRTIDHPPGNPALTVFTDVAAFQHWVED